MEKTNRRKSLFSDTMPKEFFYFLASTTDLLTPVGGNVAEIAHKLEGYMVHCAELVDLDKINQHPRELAQVCVRVWGGMPTYAQFHATMELVFGDYLRPDKA